MNKTGRNLACAACLAMGLTVSGCAMKGKAAMPYDPAIEPAHQATSFIGTQREKHMRDVGKVGITACNIMFATSANAHAGTSAGLFADSRRAEARVSTFYTLAGLQESDMQRIADRICAEAERKLAAAGYQVVPHSELKGNEAFRKLQAAGKPSPYQYKSGDSRYLVFTRNGDSVFDERYIGTASGIGQAFKAAAGNAAWQHEAVALDSLGITGINLNILIDFAELSSDGDKGFFGGLASKDTAEVSGEVLLSATGGIKVKPHGALKCWIRFGNHECMVGANKQPAFETVRAIHLQESFYTSVENTTRTSDRVAAGITTALAILTGSTSRSVTRFQVNVTPESYESVESKLTGALLDMAIQRAAEFR